MSFTCRSGIKYLYRLPNVLPMASKKKSEGFQSAAGLIRYFDTEDDKSIKINPYAVIIAGIALSIAIILLQTLWPM